MGWEHTSHAFLARRRRDTAGLDESDQFVLMTGDGSRIDTLNLGDASLEILEVYAKPSEFDLAIITP
jgi:hypothetical protein